MNPKSETLEAFCGNIQEGRRHNLHRSFSHFVKHFACLVESVEDKINHWRKFVWKIIFGGNEKSIFFGEEKKHLADFL